MAERPNPARLCFGCGSDNPHGLGMHFRLESASRDVLGLVAQHRDVGGAVAGPWRCYAEELADGRRLLHNFRRAASGAPQRVIL